MWCRRSTLSSRPPWGLSPHFACTRVIEALPPRARFVVAQDWSIAPHFPASGGMGSKKASQPPAPIVVAPALLEARDFSSSFPGWRPGNVGNTGGLAAPVCLEGWRPRCVSPVDAASAGNVLLQAGAKAKAKIKSGRLLLFGCLTFV